MPGRHFPAKLLERHDRARERGFLRPLASQWESSLIEVPKSIATRSKVVVRALATHDRLNKAAGKPFHFAAHAALAARPVVGDDSYRRAMQDIKKGNAARHAWPGEVDSVFVCDPWAAPVETILPAAPPLVLDEGCRTCD